MRKTLTLIAASTALTAAIGLPAWSAMSTPVDGSPQPFAALFEEAAEVLPLILASDDDDDDRGSDETSRRGDDDDDGEDRDNDDDDDDDDDGDDDGESGGSARNPAPAGTVVPPQNGLFGNGAPPKVQVN